MPQRNTWWDDMACRDADPAIFDEVVMRGGRPRKDGSPAGSRQDWSEARELCGRCPVKNDCLEWMLSIPVSGFVGSRTFAAGYTPDQLDKIRNKRRRAS